MRFEVHCHSEFSNIRILDCINKPKDIVKRAKEIGLSGFAITDHEALCGAVRFNKLAEECIKDGFKIAIGNEIYLIDERDANGQKYYHFILIAKDEIGFKLLKELSSNAWLNSYTDHGLRVPTLKSELKDMIEKYGHGHLIATTACLGGELSTLTLDLCNTESVNDNTNAFKIKEKIVNFLNFMKELFADDFYIECAPARSEEQIMVNNRLFQIAKAHNIKMVIGTDSHFLKKEDKYVHAAFLNSRDEDRETESFYAYAYLQDEQDIKTNFKGTVLENQYDILVQNSQEIYNKIEPFSIYKDQKIPEVEIKDYGQAQMFLNQPTLCQLLRSEDRRKRYWVNECLNALNELNLTSSKFEEYLDRLEIEADIIEYIGNHKNACLFQYFNTLQHYIDLFWDCGSIVGPGRGSSVGFLSNYLLGITQLDPVKWQLPYWRFLNKERVEYPDIDLDLAPSRRSLIFEKIREERGRLGLAQVCTFKTEGTKSAILTGCRGYRSEDYPDGIDSDEARYMSSLIPAERGFLWALEDVIHGNEEKGRKPIKTFLDEMQKYPGLLEIIQGIEGLISGRGEHASGVILYNEDPYDTAAFMLAPNGDLTTQFDLHDAEEAGDIKYDFLVTDVSDKFIKCLDLLVEGKEIEDVSLRELYNKYLHPETIDTTNPVLWESLAAGSVMDVFQFNSGVGLAIAKKVKPQNPIEMTAANALMRLMSEKGRESQQDRFARIKEQGLGVFEIEMQKVGLNQRQRTIMHKYCDEYYGCVPTQELMMQILMDAEIAGFTLGEANSARKIVAKKKMNEIPTLKGLVSSRIKDKVFRNYVWEIAIQPSLGYAFSINHSLPYSFVGIQTLELATRFNPIYWNTACLIVNSGSLNEDENDSTNYAKLAKALGDIQSAGIKLSLTDINKSAFGFRPDVENNSILFGLKAVDKIGTDVVNEILENRQYTNFFDFLNKTHLKKPAIISLIKGGAFDSMEDRKTVMGLYLWSTCDKKKRITLQNFNGLVQKGLLPEGFEFQKKVYEFNRYLKAKCKKGLYYLFDERAEKFYTENFGYDKLQYTNLGQAIEQKQWDKIYDTEMDTVRDWMKANQEEVLKTLNYLIFKEEWDKYASGSISKWEMEALCFYYHDHELKNLKTQKYGVEDFFSLSEEPDVERYYKDRNQVLQPIYNIHTIAGTCLAKDKAKSTIYLLTTSDVVTVKFRKEYFALFDKQLSQKQPDGSKKVVEKSWFSRGNMLIIKGIRRGDDFIPKKYSNTEGHQLYKIQSIDDKGDIVIVNQRAIGEEDNE